MKNLNLSNFGMQELDAKEMNVTDGGIWQVAVIFYILDNLDNIRDGLREGSAAAIAER